MAVVDSGRGAAALRELSPCSERCKRSSGSPQYVCSRYGVP